MDSTWAIVATAMVILAALVGLIVLLVKLPSHEEQVKYNKMHRRELQ
jgi:hypothetical protein